MKQTPSDDSLLEAARFRVRARQVLAHDHFDLRRPLVHASGAAYPALAKRGHGARFVDSRDQVWLDWVGAGGPNLLGHGDSEVAEAVSRAASEGTSFGAVHPLQIQLAERLVEMIPCAEQVAFGKNGSDALTAALRVARATTGREIFLHYGMHGFHDWFLAGRTTVRGVPHELAGKLIPFRYDDLEQLDELFERFAGRVAGVLMEPIREELPSEGYLRAVADRCRAEGALLIWDEVVTAFRLGPGGAQTVTGVQPDLACLGKGMANGFPLSALVGTREAMAPVPAVGFGMTFRGEVAALAAANVVTRRVLHEGVADRLRSTGAELRVHVAELAERHRLKVRLGGPEARSTFHFDDQSGVPGVRLLDRFVDGCLTRGLFTNGNLLPCFAHGPAEIQETVAVLDEVLGELGEVVAAPDELRPPLRACLATGYLECLRFGPTGVVLGGWILVDGEAAERLDVTDPQGNVHSLDTAERPDVVTTPGAKTAAGFQSAELPWSDSGPWVLRAWCKQTCIFQVRLLPDEEGEPLPVWVGDGVALVRVE